MTTSRTNTKTSETSETAETTQAETAPILSPAMLEAQKIQTAPGWRPAAGDTITGTIVNMAVRKLRPIGNRPARNILVLTLDTGAEQYTAVHVLHTMLQAGLDNIRPTNGDKLSIVYNGKFQPEDQAKDPYHSYTVTAPDAVAVPFNWDRLG